MSSKQNNFKSILFWLGYRIFVYLITAVHKGIIQFLRVLEVKYRHVEFLFWEKSFGYNANNIFIQKHLNQVERASFLILEL